MRQIWSTNCKGQLQDLQAKLQTEEIKAEVYEQNMIDLTAARDYAVKRRRTAGRSEIQTASEASLRAGL